MTEKITVNIDYAGKRIDAFLAEVNAYKSRSLASKFCEQNKVLVNNNYVSKSYIVYENDVVEYEISDDKLKVEAEDIPLNICYEDDDIIVISKQPGLVCHPANGNWDGTLVNALINHCGKDNLFKPTDDDTRLGIVHRLDADTSGLIICAKTQQAGEILSKAMKDHSTSRHYKTLVYGNVKHDTGKIDVPLLRTLNNRPKMIASNSAKAKSATTSFNVLERINTKDHSFTLLDCKIHTGRTHQIRAHMEYINHSVVGDPLYNSSKPKDFNADKELGLNRQFLHSYKIAFVHPITNKQMSFCDELSQDLEDALFRLKSGKMVAYEGRYYD